MNLAELIERRRPHIGSLRAMAQRAADANRPISHVQLGEYAKGAIREVPSEATRLAIAAALDVSLDEVTAAAFETAAPHITAAYPDGFGRAGAFAHLTEGRSDAEIEQLFGVVRAALAGFDTVRNHATHATTDDSVVTGEQPGTTSDRERR